MNELNKTHIKNLVSSFYQRVQQDELLGPIFNDVAKVDWEEHILLLCRFWNSVMLKTNEYNGNAMLKHIEMNRLVPFTPAHFRRWLKLFKEEAHKHLPAEAASLIVERARMIGHVIQQRTIGPRDNILDPYSN